MKDAGEAIASALKSITRVTNLVTAIPSEAPLARVTALHRTRHTTQFTHLLKAALARAPDFLSLLCGGASARR